MAKKKPVVSKYGQWKYPGQDTIIPNANGNITMQGVPYPVLGIDDLGNQQMMMPGMDYQFPGNSVYEIPMAKMGGTKKVKIHSLPKAQNGTEWKPPSLVEFGPSRMNPATFQDSIDVANASQKAMDWYMANGYSNLNPSRFINPKDPQIRVFPENPGEWKPSKNEGVAHDTRLHIGGNSKVGADDLGQGGIGLNIPKFDITIPAEVNQLVQDGFSGVGDLMGQGITGLANLAHGDQLAQWLNHNQFLQYGDEHQRIVNTDAPRILYDTRIQPRTKLALQGTAPGYFSGNADVVDLPVYEKWYTTPWSLLSDEDKRKRLEFGILTGTPFKDWNDERLIHNYPDLAMAHGGRRQYDDQTIKNAAASGYAPTQEGAAQYERNKWAKNPRVYDAETIANAAKSGYPATQSGAAEYELNGWGKNPNSKNSIAKKEPNPNTDIAHYMKTELGLDKKQTSYSERKKLAEKYGIKDYSGSAKQNIELLNKIKSEEDPADAVRRMLSGEKLEDITNMQTGSATATQPEDFKVPYNADPNRRAYPITLSGDAAIDNMRQQLFGNLGKFTDNGKIPLDDPKYNPYVGGIGPTRPVRVSYGKFQTGGEEQPQYETVTVNDPNDPRYKEYQYLQNLYNWSNIQDFDRRSAYRSQPQYFGFTGPGLQDAYSPEEYVKDYNRDTGPYREWTETQYGSGEFNTPYEPGIINYNSDETGIYGSKATKYNFGTRAELNKWIRKNQSLDPRMLHDYEKGNRAEPWKQLMNKYKPIGYDALIDWYYPQYGLSFDGDVNSKNQWKYKKPTTQFIEDNLDRKKLRSIYPELSDKELDDYVYANRLNPDYITNFINPENRSIWIDKSNDNKDPNRPNPLTVKQDFYNDYDDNSNLIKRNKNNSYEAPVGAIGYLPESIENWSQIQQAYYLPRFGSPESYLGKRYVYDAPPKPPVADVTRRKYPIKSTGDADIDAMNLKLFGDQGTLTDNGFIPLDDPKYHPYNGIGPVEPRTPEKEMRRIKTPKFTNGGDISVPDLRRVKIHSLPKAQYGPPDWRNILDYGNAAPPAKQNLVGDVRKVARPAAVAESTKVPTQKLPANFKQLKEEADANAAADRRMAEDEFVAKWDQVNGLTPRIPQPGDPDWQMPYPNDPAGLPSVPIFESLLMAPVALGSAGLAGLGEMAYGAAAATPLFQATGAALSASPAALPGLSINNAVNAAFAAHGLKTIVSGEAIEPWRHAAKTGNVSDYLSAAGQNLMTGLETLPVTAPLIKGGYELAKPAINAAGEFLTTQTPLKNAYKINPWAIKENPETFLYRAQPKDFDATASTLNTLKKKLASGEGTATERSLWNQYVKQYEAGHSNLVAQNDFYGKWFENDPNRLDWYLNSGDKYDAGTPMNILRTKVPTSEAEAFKVANVKSAQPISASMNTEFVLPQEMIQSSEVFPETSLQDLIAQHNSFNTPDWLRGYKGTGTPKKLTAQMPEMPAVGPQATVAPWTAESLPGLHLESTVTGGPISKIVEPKTGLINTEQALKIISKESGGKEKLELVKNAIGENIPTKMDYNKFRKLVQDAIIPLERKTVNYNSNYGLGHIGFPSPKKSNIQLALDNSEQELARLTGELDKVSAQISDIKGFRESVANDPSKAFLANGTDEQIKTYLQGIVDHTKEQLALSVRQVENNRKMLSEAPLENETLLLSNKEKLGRGVDAHNNPRETLGHIHYYVDAENPNTAVMTQMQSDAFQGTHRTMPNSLEEATNKLTQAQEDLDWTKGLYFDNDPSSLRIMNKANEEFAFDKATVENYVQKSLLDKKHQERYLQEFVDHAASKSMDKVRIPTSETAAKVQGYNPLEFDPGTVAATEARRKVMEAHKLYGPESKEFKEANDAYDALVKNTKPDYIPAQKTILKKYEQMPKTIKKIFGEDVQIVTDSKGNTWYEFNIPTNFKEGKGEIKAFKKGGTTSNLSLKRVKINALPNNWKSH